MGNTKELSVILKLKDSASEGMKKISGELQRQQKEAEKTKKAWESMQKIGLAMGTAIVGSLTACVAAAESDRRSQAKLKTAIENTGASYNDLKGSLESVIAATARKTGISDEQQRESMSQLLAITGDYETSLKALPVALDLAAFKGIDTASAATILGKALNGNVTALQRMGISIEENASAQEILQAVMDRTGGAAEEMASPFAIMRNEFDEIAESVGYLLLPALRLLTNLISPIVGAIKKLVDNSGVLGEVLVTLGAIVGVAALALGAYAAAQNSATVASLGATVQLAANTAAHLAATIATTAGTVATIAGTVARTAGAVAMGVLTVATWAATAAMSALGIAEAAALAPLVAIVGVIGGAIGVVGGLGYGIYRLADWVSNLGDNSTETIPELERLKGVVADSSAETSRLNTELEDAKGTLENLATVEEHVKTNMEDAFGTHHLEAIQKLESRIGSLEDAMDSCKDAIAAANDELQDLTAPRLEGMQQMEDDIFNVKQKIDLLKLEKLKLPIGADTSGIDSQIATLERQQQTLELEYSTTFDPLIRNAEEAVQTIQGLNTEMAPEAVMTRIQTLGQTIQNAQTSLNALTQAHADLQGQLEVHQGLYLSNLTNIQAEQLELNNLVYDLSRPGGLIDQATANQEKANQQYQQAQENVQAVYDEMVYIPGVTDLATWSAKDWTAELNNAAKAAGNAGSLADSAIGRTNIAISAAQTAWSKATSALSQANAALSQAGAAQTTASRISGQVSGLSSSLSSLASWGTSLSNTVSAIGSAMFPHAAEGGIVTRPTVLLAGEAGPEAIIPLDKAGKGGDTYNITISAGAFVGSRAEADSFANMILGSLRTKQRYALGAAQW